MKCLRKALLSEVQKSITDFNPDAYTDNTEEISIFIKKKESELSDARATKRQIEGTKSLFDRLTIRIQENNEEIENIQPEEIETKIPIYEKRTEEIENEIKFLECELNKHKEEILRLSTIKATKRDFLVKLTTTSLQWNLYHKSKICLI